MLTSMQTVVITVVIDSPNSMVEECRDQGIQGISEEGQGGALSVTRLGKQTTSLITCLKIKIKLTSLKYMRLRCR